MLPADIEAGLVGYLAPLVGVKVATRIPNPRPDQLVRISRAGGVQHTIVHERPLILVECWALTEPEAFDIASRTWGAMRDLDRGAWLGAGWVSECWPAVPISYTDAETRLPRYQFTAQMVVTLKESA